MTERSSKDQNLSSKLEFGSRGLVFAATGRSYTDLALRAARTIRKVMPDASIDLFTNQNVDDDVFDKVFRLPDNRRRPKMYAMRNSRFERTILLDADIIVLADISEIFDVLDRYDLAGALGVRRDKTMTPADTAVPRCLNPVNTGVLAFRASMRIRDFSLAWESEMKSRNDRLDQPTFRELLYFGDLDFVALASNYNCIDLLSLDSWTTPMGAPKILHVRQLHEDPPGDTKEPFDLAKAIGAKRAKHVTDLLAADWSLGGNGKRVQTPAQQQKNRLAKLEESAFKRSDSPDSKGVGFVDLFRVKRNKHPVQGLKLQHREQLRRAQDLIFQAAVSAVASQGKQVRICKVGANDDIIGNSNFEFIKENLRLNSDILLVEPQKYLIPFLEENYNYHPSHQIFNAAVGPEKNLTLHAIYPEHWPRFPPLSPSNRPSYLVPTGATSRKREAVVSWIRKRLPQVPDPDDLVTSLDVRSAHLVEFLKDSGRDTQIDVLQVGTKAYCDDVIYSCDIELTRPAIIQFETSSLSNVRLERLYEYLSKYYMLNELECDTVAVSRT